MPQERRQLQRELADALAGAARGPEAAEAYLQAADGADPASRLDSLRRAIEQLLITGHLAKANTLLDSLFREVGLALPRWSLGAWAWQRLLVRLRGYRWKVRDSKFVSEGDKLEADLSRAMAIGYHPVDPIVSGVFGSRALREALALGDASRALVMLCHEAITLSSRGGTSRLAASARLMTSMELFLRSSTDEYAKTWHLAARSLYLYFEGRNGEGADLMKRAALAFAATGRFSAYEADNVHVFRSFALRHAGRLTELGELVDTCLRDAVRRGDQYLNTTIRRSCAIVFLAQDRPAEALDSLSKATWEVPEGHFHLQNWYELEAQGEIALYEGKTTEQQAHLAERIDACRGSLLRHIEIVSSLLDWLDARLLLARSAGPQGRADRRRAKALGRRLLRRGRHGGIFGLLVSAAVEHQEGRPDEAVRLLRTCLDATRDDYAAQHAIARLRLASLVGGDEGARERAQAEAWAKSQGVVALERFAQVIAPGFA